MATRIVTFEEKAINDWDRNALIPLTDGVDELETLFLYDVLSRANIRVTLAACETKDGKIIHASHGMKIIASTFLDACASIKYDIIIVPGGNAMERFRDCHLLIQLLKLQIQSKEYYAALSNAPAEVLMPHMLLNGKATCHPSRSLDMIGYFVDQDFELSENCLTSQGPGTCTRFALKVVELLRDHTEAKRVAEEINFHL